MTLATGKTFAQTEKGVMLKGKKITRSRVRRATRRMERLGLYIHNAPEKENLINPFRSSESILEMLDEAIGIRPLFDTLRDEVEASKVDL